FVGFNLASRFGWAWVYILLAIVMSLGLVVTVTSPEPSKVEVRSIEFDENVLERLQDFFQRLRLKKVLLILFKVLIKPFQKFFQRLGLTKVLLVKVLLTLEEAVIKPFQDFFQRFGLKKVLLILVFTIFYLFSDAMVGKMAVPFLKTLFEDGTIGTVRQGIGLVATIVGTLAGGAILSKIGVNRSLWVFGFLQAISNIGYYAISVVGKNDYVLLAAINVENFCGGLGTAGFLGFLMVLCNPRFSATQYALLSSLFAVGRDLLASPFSGESAQFIQRNISSWDGINQIVWFAGSDGKGWALFFLLTLVLAIPGMMFLPFFAPWNGEFKKVDSLPLD
ncbi:MAG: MFS transporter, partial [Pseudanabaena sp.]